MKARFKESSLVATSNVSVEGDFYAGAFADPQMIHKWPTRFSPGWYSFSLKLDGDPGGAPVVYFDMGFGYNEVERIELVARKSKGTFQGVIKLPVKPNSVRLDPTNTNNLFSVRAFQAKRISTPVMLMRGGFRLMRAAILQPSRVKPMLHRAGDLLFGKSVTGVNIRPVITQQEPYSAWQSAHDFKPERDGPTYDRLIEKLENPPKISVLMPVYNPNPVFLKQAVKSVMAQIYPNWELCIADDASTDPEVIEYLTEISRKDLRVRVWFRKQNGHISQASNSALGMTTGEWLVPLDHDDILRPHALAEVALHVSRNPDVQVLYSDEDKLSESGHRFDPHFKPDFSPELFRSMNYLNHLTAHRTQNVKTAGGWREGYEGAQDYDLNLRILDMVGWEHVGHIPKILYHWRAAQGSTAKAQDEKGYAWEAGRQALEDHLKRQKLPAQVRDIAGVPFYRVQYEIQEPAPKVTLIIPTRDRLELLSQAVTSILTLTDYPNYEILIVNNNSEEDETLEYFETIQREHANVRCIDWPQPFNFSAINNFAVANSTGEMVAMVNNDIEVISPGWLTEMVSWAQQPRIGCVGAKLYYPDISIQHAGVIAGIGGVAGHSHKYYDGTSHGYFSRLKVAQNVSAVTAACLLVRREVFEAVGGLDEENLTVAFNDIDFCFKVYGGGWMNVWTPWAELIHHESKSRGQEDTAEKKARFMREVRQMQKRWSSMIERDPFYNPNLTRDHEDFSIRV